MSGVIELDASTLAALIGLVDRHTGINMTEKKSVLLQGRIRPRLQALGLTSYAAYLKRVESDPAEVPVFINMVTTNDTLFFRTPHVWEYLTGQFLPDWAKAHPNQTLKIWSAAAATGEEAYSIAMSCEEFRLRVPTFQYQILATDISTAVLETGRNGRYAGRSVERFRQSHPQLLQRYFQVDQQQIQTLPSLQKPLRFAEHNLFKPLSGGERFDLVFLRNVLIYFDAEHQQQVVNQARKAMTDQARMILGESESIKHLQTVYEYESPLVYRIRADSGCVTQKRVAA